MKGKQRELREFTAGIDPETLTDLYVKFLRTKPKEKARVAGVQSGRGPEVRLQRLAGSGQGM